MEQINKKLDTITKLIQVIPTTGNNKKGGRFTNQYWQPIYWDLHGYCWSCGYKVDYKHNSVACLKKKDGHQDAATRLTTMGGSQAGKQSC
eukprot:9296285-Ditylum_brightwellii.AAC.1